MSSTVSSDRAPASAVQWSVDGLHYVYEACLSRVADCESLLELLSLYAEDEMGGGEALGDFARKHLLGELRARRDFTHAFLVRRRRGGDSEKDRVSEKETETDTNRQTERKGEGEEPVAKKAKNADDSIKACNKNYETAPIGVNYEEDEAVALAICFDGFSTFYCRKLLNIHDFAVKYSSRRQGLGSLLMMKIRQFAEEHGYCKITLEVLEGNHPAKKLYAQHGFAAYELDPIMGKAMFWQCLLNQDEEHYGDQVAVDEEEENCDGDGV